MLKNKKIVISILALSILASPFVSYRSAVKASQSFFSTEEVTEKAPKPYFSTEEVTEVSRILSNVLSSEQEIMKTGKSKDCSSVINDKKLLQIIQKEQKFNEDWYNNINFKIYDYTSNATINNITQLSHNIYKLDVTFKAELKLSKDSQTRSRMSDDYIVEIEKKSGKWVISKMLEKVYSQNVIKGNRFNIIDKAKTNPTLKTLSNDDILINNDILTNNDMILETKSKELDINSTNIDTSVKSYKEMIKKSEDVSLNGSEKAMPAYAGTNRVGVSNYAYKYSMNHNPNYRYIEGADCTNFASQAVHVGGGVPGSSYWYAYTTSWINVESFFTYMDNNGYLSGGRDITTLTDGDILQFRHWYNPSFSHATIVTGFINNEPVLSAHSNDRQDWPIAEFWKSFYSARKLHFW